MLNNATIEEIRSLRDAEWTDAIHQEFPHFDVEDLELSNEEYKELTFPKRWIRLLKLYLDSKKYDH